MGWISAKRLVPVVATLLAATAAGPMGASAAVQPYGTNDFGGFRNVLPPGTNGLVDTAQLLAYETTKARPRHNNDQLGMYSALTTAAPNITAAQIGSYFKDATFGVKSGDAESVENPEPGVTIVRDSAFGVPHIYGDTRAELMFAIGYATAEDRLFFIDALRHAGQGDLAAFAGGSNVSMDESVWASEPYTHQDLVNQVMYGLNHSPLGHQIYSDATNYVDGINAYIARAKNPLFTATTAPGRVRRARHAGPSRSRSRTWSRSRRSSAASSATAAAISWTTRSCTSSSCGASAASTATWPGPRSSYRSLTLRGRHPAGTRAARPGAGPKRPDHSGFATFDELRRPRRPRGPDHRPRTLVPLPDAAEAEQGDAQDARHARPGSVQLVNHVVAGAAPTRGHAQRVGRAAAAGSRARWARSRTPVPA